jgi:methionyl-tRNA formyltransferase
MNETTRPVGSFIMGLGSLCIQCAEHLHEQEGFRLRGLVSADQAVIAWGRKMGIPALHLRDKVRYSASNDELEAFLGASPFDYLFSIINAMFLPEEIIRLPRRLAINFHDSELPKYAGIDASSWAIMRRERRHAVTWHLMARGIDEGDIVKQAPVSIAPRETAHTLNVKSLEAGLTSFKALLQEIRDGELRPRRQPREQRSYYSRSKPHLPEMHIWTHGIMSWQRSAEDLEALTRALDYGPERNSVGTPKLLIGDDFYIVPAITISASRSGVEPGTVVRNDGRTLTISTSTRDLLVDRVLTLEGQPRSIAELSVRHHLAEGARLPEIAPHALQRIKDLDKDLMWKETYWASAIKDCVPIPTGRNHPPARPGAPVELRLPEETRERLWELADQSGVELGTFLLGCFGGHLAMRHGVRTVPIWYSDGEYRRDVAGISKLFSPFALVNLFVDGGSAVLDQVRQTARQLLEVKRHRHFPFDLLYRHPLLRDGRSLEELRQFGFSFRRTGDPGLEHPASENGFELALEVIADGRSFSMKLGSARLGASDLRAAAEAFSSHLEVRATA